ncbi:MAG TPA: M28 family metallopeptidase, partial [Granulicella sp.]|nr:M28 family metallopeptidase [Granulicella sp.]
DLIQFVDFKYVANVARLNSAVLADLAAAPGPPQEVHILTQALDNNTELKWDPPAGAPANTTYEVVWRPTDQPNWTEALSTGSNTAVRIALSKDNVVFGVRSVDPAGHRSVAVLPLPQRRTAPPAAKK